MNGRKAKQLRRGSPRDLEKERTPRDDWRELAARPESAIALSLLGVVPVAVTLLTASQQIVLLTLCGVLFVALLITAWIAQRWRRRLAGAGAICMVVVTAVVSATGVGASSSASVERAALGNMRLAITSEINGYRKQLGVAPLVYDPVLSVTAQQQAGFEAAVKAGQTLPESVQDAPMRQGTNMWAVLTAPTEPRFDWLAGNAHPRPETKPARDRHGYLEFDYGADTGHHRPSPLLSADFDAIGIGLVRLSGNQFSGVIYLIGPNKPGAPNPKVPLLNFNCTSNVQDTTC